MCCVLGAKSHFDVAHTAPTFDLAPAALHLYLFEELVSESFRSVLISDVIALFTFPLDLSQTLRRQMIAGFF